MLIFLICLRSNRDNDDSYKGGGIDKDDNKESNNYQIAAVGIIV